MSPETAVERFNIDQGFNFNTTCSRFRPSQEVKVKRCTDSRKTSVRQDVVITLGKDSVHYLRVMPRLAQ
jgi:hypothetical protein